MQYLEIDGEQLVVASLLRKGTAIAIDLSLTVATASVCFGLLSWFVPLDDATAKLPIGIVTLAALSYIAFGRNHLTSFGRRILRLKLVKLPGRQGMLFNRAISVHIDPEPPDENRPLALSLCLIAAATLAAAVALSAALGTTHIFRAVEAYVEARPPNIVRQGVRPVLSKLPRALLIGKLRGFVQVSADWGHEIDVLDFYLMRDDKHGWRVAGVRSTDDRQLGNYSLGASEADIPVHP
ncbi:MAG: hypothetical protein AAF458_03425 [Pseudomonadota bacterium]